ncbi:P63C domain-containing protein [Serratia marcescens]|uniref:P63C domain-containing protein n=1 Tax=Serratia marcescens TaxID=615 RepID=UPI0024698458|nr:P63C domain-containing protein [Serratia marcescens]WGL77964.1 P63C domain-containing protein [Serratia marcescens]
MKDDNSSKGKARGGVARANALTKEQRSAIAKKAAAARWKDKPLKATHQGNFMDEFGIDAECYVLDDDAKTVVVTKTGLAQLLGLGDKARDLDQVLGSQYMSKYRDLELQRKMENPFNFQLISRSKTVHQALGYDITSIVDIGRALIEAKDNDDLPENRVKAAEAAQKLINASAKAGIKGVGYALAGYRPEVQEVINAFKAFVREEARQYEKEFPDELYEEWYRLYGLNRPEKGRPIRFGQLTNMQIYVPLAKSKGKILEQIRASRDESGKQSDKLHLFLSEIGVKALRQHIGKLLGVAAMSDNKDEYEAGIEKVFGRMKPEL